MRILITIAAALSPLFALAETPLSPDAFDRYTRGKTLYYSSDGSRYGAEEYFDQRRVRWTFLDGQCKEGSWYASGQDICFVYEDTPEPQCWSFFKEGSGLRAVFENDPASTTLYEAQQDDEPMLCLGPDVGV